MLDKTKLIQDLLSLVEEEQKYKKEYERMLHSDELTYLEIDKFRNMRTPNKATTTDALKIISRLSMQQSKE